MVDGRSAEELLIGFGATAESEATCNASSSEMPGECTRQVVESRCRIISVKFAEPKFTPIRPVVSRSRCRPTGKYPSWKAGRMLEWETVGELNAFRLLDCDPRVTRFSEQPCEVLYVVGSEFKRHYPDIYVEVAGEKELWEVKADSRAAEPEIVVRTKLLAEELNKYGLRYRLVLDGEVRKQPRLNNASTLLRYGRDVVEDLDREHLRLAVRDAGSLTWGDACSGAYGPDGKHLLCRLVLEGVLKVDMDLPFSPQTRFTVSDEDL